MTTAATTYAQCVAILTGRGITADDARALLDSAINAGLEIDDQPDNDYLFTPAEIDLIAESAQ